MLSHAILNFLPHRQAEVTIPYCSLFTLLPNWPGSDSMPPSRHGYWMSVTTALWLLWLTDSNFQIILVRAGQRNFFHLHLVTSDNDEAWYERLDNSIYSLLEPYITFWFPYRTSLHNSFPVLTSADSAIHCPFTRSKYSSNIGDNYDNQYQGIDSMGLYWVTGALLWEGTCCFLPEMVLILAYVLWPHIL